MNHVEIFSLVLQFSAFAIAVGLPIYRTAVTGLFWPSFRRMWIYLVVWAVLFSMVVPAFVAWAFHDKRAWLYFPEGPAAMLILFLGWIYPLILCGITLGIRRLWVRWRSRPN
jgi:hypothetical protein